MEDANLKPVFDIAFAYDPRHFGIGTFTDVYTVRLWVARGADVEKDIVPTMTNTFKRNGHVKTFSYMTAAIERAVEARKAREAAQQQDGAKPVSNEAAKAKNIAFLTRKLGKRLPTEERWLKDYEQQNGEVAL